MLRSVDALIGAEFGGTFVMDSRGCRGRNFASFEYCPDAYEDEAVVNSHSRFVVVDEIPANGHESIAPVFPKLKGSLRENLKRLLGVGPQWAIRVYEKARLFHGERPDIIMRLLPVVMAELVAEGVYNAQTFRQTKRESWSCHQILAGFAAECPTARAMLAALNGN